MERPVLISRTSRFRTFSATVPPCRGLTASALSPPSWRFATVRIRSVPWKPASMDRPLVFSAEILTPIDVLSHHAGPNRPAFSPFRKRFKSGRTHPHGGIVTQGVQLAAPFEGPQWLHPSTESETMGLIPLEAPIFQKIHKSAGGLKCSPAERKALS